MRALVLYLCVLGIVSAADDQTERPAYIISQNGSPPGYSSGKPFYGTAVSSNNVKVLPNSYKTLQDSAGGKDSPISVPVIVDSNTPFQGNTNEPIPVPVSYSDEDSAPTEQSQPTNEYNDTQRARFRKIPPIPVLVKAPASAYRSVTSTPRPFKARDPQLTNDNNSGNPYSTISPSFRLWPKLPEPVPVPVLTTDSYLKNSNSLNTNLVPQYLQKVPLPVKAPASLSNEYQQNQNAVRYLDSSQFQTQQGQSNSIQPSQGSVYIIIPGGNNNAQIGSYQTPTAAQASYQSQTSQSGNQRYIIVIPTGTNSQSNNQNTGYSFNPYFGSQQGQPGQQQLFNSGQFAPSSAGSQPQVPAGQQAPLNYAIFAPNAPGNQLQTQYPDQQSALKYAIFGQQSTPGSLANSAGQAPQNYAVLALENAPGVQPNTAGQSPLNFAVFGSSNGGSIVPSATPAPQLGSYSPSQSSTPQYVGFPSSTPQPQYVGYPSSTQQPQYVGYPSSTQQPQYVENPSSTQQPQYVGYPSSTQQPQYVGYPSSTQQPQYVGSPSSTQQPQYVGYPSSTQPPQYVGYSSTPAPSQSSYSQSTPVSSVSFSGAGNSYSYSI